MISKAIICCVCLGMLCSTIVKASVLGDLLGVIRDPQHQVIKDAKVTLRSRTSDVFKSVATNENGEFFFRAVPIGEYVISVEANGFARREQSVTVTSRDAPVLQIQLEIALPSEQMNVSASPDQIVSESASPITLISRKSIEVTPGADRSNSLSMITNYVPGANITHDQLHVRGGHQVSWLVDGVPIANTNIASNVGPQFDPKDIDYLEVQRGSYASEYGDRTYAVFNIVPRTGFERQREAEIVLSYGNFNQTNDQFNFGSHTNRFAYYASLSGNYSGFGLETPTSRVLHDEANGLAGFSSLIFNPTTRDQLRLIASLRGDNYEVPNDSASQERGVRDVERERDGFINFSWVRTYSTRWLLTVSPFYHFNSADFIGGSGDTPFIPQERRSSRYAGAQIVFSALTRQHNAIVGVYGFYQKDDQSFGITKSDRSVPPLSERVKPTGNLEAAFIEDQYKPMSWLTLTGGLRFTHFSGSIAENAASPRIGAAIRLPRLNLVLRGSYSRYYQAPPLSTVSGPLLEFAVAQGFASLPLRGERDEEQQFGLAVPVKGWMLDANYFRSHIKNLFDHSAIGESNIFLPLTIDRARIRGFELSIRSPQSLKRLHVYLTYSHQRAEGSGGITGGLTDFAPGEDFFFLDHDQRNTLNIGGDVSLPKRSYFAASLHYGSGFVNGEGPDHLPGHTTFDLSAGKSFGERWSVAVHSLNVADNRFLLDNSATFGGTHFVEPRQVYFEVRYRFHY